MEDTESFMTIIDYIKESITGISTPILVNIGAERGDGETTDFCIVAPHGKIYSIEADPRTYKLLEERKKQFPNLQTFNLAISNKDGKHIFYQSGGTNPQESLKVNWTSASSLLSRERMRDGRPYPWMVYNEIEVETKTLDSWAKENDIDHIDFLWVDIEGATHLLIEGGHNTLRNTRYFYTEAFDWKRYEGECLKSDIITLVPNFQLIADFGNDILFKNKEL